MTEHDQGFVDGLRIAAFMADAKRKHHFANASKESLSSDDREQALNCSIVMGFLASDIDVLVKQIRDGRISPQLIINSNLRKETSDASYREEDRREVPGG